MPENKHVFMTVAEAVSRELHNRWGPPDSEGAPSTAQVAVACMQLSLRYFVETKAPKAIVWDFFLQLMGIEGDKAKLVEEDGKLRIEPPKRSLIVVADAMGNTKLPK